MYIIVEPSVVDAIVDAVVVKPPGSDVVVSEFNGVVVSSKDSKSSGSNTCLGLTKDSTVISSPRPREAASELVDKSLRCMLSMNSVEFAL